MSSLVATELLLPARGVRRVSGVRGGEALLEVGDGALQRARDRAANELAVDDSAQPRTWVELHREAVVEVVSCVREAAFVARVGEPSLDACVLHEAMRIERAQRHLELDATAQ